MRNAFFSTALLAAALLCPAFAQAAEAVDPDLRAALRRAATETDSFSDRFDAEVWLMDMSQRLAKRVPDARYRIEMLKHVHYEATRAGLAPELVLAIIDVESGFNQYAISSAGAQGLMQVMPFWLREIGRPGDNLFQIQTNLRFGCTILKFYLEKEKNNLQEALKRYNGTKKPHYGRKVNKVFHARWRPQ